MAEKRENIISHAMRSGLVLGGLMVVSYLLSATFVKNIPVQFLLGLIGLIVSIWVIFYFTRKFDKDVLKGEISYVSALSYGFYMFFFAGMIVALFLYIYLRYLDPNFLTELGNSFIQYYKDHHLLEDSIIKQFEAQLSGLEVPTPAQTAIASLWTFSFTGFIIVLFTSIFFRKKKNNKTQN